MFRPHHPLRLPQGPHVHRLPHTEEERKHPDWYPGVLPAAVPTHSEETARARIPGMEPSLEEAIYLSLYIFLKAEALIYKWL